MRGRTILILASVLFVGCGTSNIRTGNSGSRGAQVEIPSGMEPSLEQLAESWVIREAGPGFTIVPLATLYCADGTRIAILWPAMRAGEIIDDDVVALRIARGPEGDRVVEDWQARDHDSLRARCDGARIERGASGLPPSRIGEELTLRAAEVRDAIASRDGERFRRAAILFSQLFDDRSVASEGMPDALTDLMGNTFRIERAEVVGSQLTIHFLRRGTQRQETARLIPVVGGSGLVVIEIN